MTTSNNMTASVSSLANISVNANIDLNDVVNVFITKYETGLINQRTSKQHVVADLNKQIKSVTDTILAAAKEYVNGTPVIGETDNGIFTTKSSVKSDSFEFKSERGIVQYTIEVKVESNTSTSQYNRDFKGSIYAEYSVDPELVNQYKESMAEKGRITAILGQINSDLRDVSRKERQVRGLIAEQRLIDQGMSELVSNPELLKLIDTSTIIVE